ANDSVAALDTVLTDASGNYSFLTVKDTVYVKVAPDSASYPNELPTYYQNGPVFTSGTPVLVPNCDSVTLNFSSLNGLNPGGPGFIAGIVSQGAGKSGVGAPVARLDLVLFNANGDAVQHRQTDANGYFRFDNLAQETFTIWTDLPRVNNALAPEVAATTNAQDTLRFELNDSTLVQLLSVSVTDPAGSKRVFEAFPNPFHENAFIRFHLHEGQRIELELLNVLGQPVKRLDAGYRGAGVHQVSIAARDLDLPSGVWLVRLRTANHQQVLRLVHH
ncbi:MAG: T9SS type A sorting domain-containing protein, partial [Bacteroidota bacterium]